MPKYYIFCAKCGAPKDDAGQTGHEPWCPCLTETTFDESDKEMFDAQLISTLKDRIKELEEGIREAYDFLKDAYSEYAIFLSLEALLPKEKQE